MSKRVQLVGRASPAFEAALSARAIRTSGADEAITIISSWTSISSLCKLVESRSHSLVVEDAGAGAVAIGPSFMPNVEGCIQCYLARRRSNGGQHCRPTDVRAVAVARQLAEIIDRLVRSPDARLDRHVVISNDVTSEHVLLPVPTCAVCRIPRISRACSDVEEAVSDRIGIVHEVTTETVARGLYAAEAIGCRTDAFDVPRALNRGFAIDESPDAARRRAIGETIERYCAVFRLADAPVARIDELDGGCVPPVEFPAAHRSTRSGRYRWVRATRVHDRADTWVPAALVYIPYRDALDDTVASQSSVGLAASTEIDYAVQRGVAEVIERDACLKAWRRGSSVRRVDPSAYLSDTLQSVEGLHVARVQHDTGFSIAVAFLERASFPLTSTGLSARPTLGEAVRHAVLEAVQSRFWLEHVSYEGCVMAPPRTMIDHAFAHASRPDLRTSRASWLFPQSAAQYPSEQSWSTAVDSVPGCCYVSLATSDVASIGLSVVRVLVPGRVIADDDSLFPILGGSEVPHPFG